VPGAAPGRGEDGAVTLRSWAVAVVALLAILLAGVGGTVAIRGWHPSNSRCWVYDAGGEPEYYNYAQPGCTEGR